MITNLGTALQGRYTIDREIGRGGMATVYLARDVRHSRAVALKVLNPELGAVLGVERFLAEIEVTANLQHPNLLPLFDSGEASGLLYYVMPFVQGESLRARLDREKQLPVDEAVRITTAIAGALDYAHRHKVIHRDLKPENILMQEGQPLIADFGIALAVSKAGGERITQTGLSLGTPQYMSPEQATGDRVVDGRTDIYSLGAMAYEMLVGDPPHHASTSQAIIAKVLTERPTSVRTARPSVPPHVDAAIGKSLEKLAADRFATAREFAE
jgi:serine/threonine protein kinase